MKVVICVLNCLASIGQDISEDKYLLSLIEGKKKFEGWVQIELAKRLKKNHPEVFSEVHCEYKITPADIYADIFLINSETSSIFLEVKFVVMSNAVTNSRNSLRKQMLDNKEFGLSLGVAVLVSHYGNTWFKKEVKKIEKDLPVKLVETAFANQDFSIMLFKSR